MRKKRVSKSLIDFIYCDLEKNYLGRENAIKRSEYAAMRGLSEREMRTVTHEINYSTAYKGIISTSTSLYMCNSKEECLKATGVTYRSAFTLLRKARCMEWKVRNNGQFEFNDKDATLLISYYYDRNSEFAKEGADGLSAENGDNDEE